MGGDFNRRDVRAKHERSGRVAEVVGIEIQEPCGIGCRPKDALAPVITSSLRPFAATFTRMPHLRMAARTWTPTPCQTALPALQSPTRRPTLRLRTHLSDDVAGRWDRFSWYGVRKINITGSLAKIPAPKRGIEANEAISTLEALLMRVTAPSLNRKRENLPGLFTSPRRPIKPAWGCEATSPLLSRRSISLPMPSHDLRTQRETAEGRP